MATTAPPMTVPAPAPAAPAATKATTTTVTVSANVGFEIARYVLYLLDFIFGVLMWGVVADKLFIDVPGYTSNTCFGFGKVRENLGDGTVTFSTLCSVIIAFGVLMMIALLVVVTWHSLGLFNFRSLSLKAEGITFVVMSVLWFILGISALALSKTYENFHGVREDGVDAAIAGGWLAGFTHAASAVIAFLQLRMTGGKTEELPTTTQAPAAQPYTPPQQPYTTPQQPYTAPQQPYTAPQQAYTPPQPVMSQPMGTPQQYASAPQPSPQYNYAQQQPAVAPVQPGVPMQAVPPGQAPAAPPPPGHPQA